MKAMVAGSPLVRTFEQPQTSSFNTQNQNHTLNKPTSNSKINNKSQVSNKSQISNKSHISNKSQVTNTMQSSTSTTQSRNVSQNSLSSNNDQEFTISPVISENRPVPVPRAKKKPITPTQNSNSSSRDNLTLVQPRADFQEKTAQDIKSSQTNVSLSGHSDDTEASNKCAVKTCRITKIDRF